MSEMVFGAFTNVPERFESFGELTAGLERHPNTQGLELTRVFLVSGFTSEGVRAVVLDGVDSVVETVQHLVVSVGHEIMGKPFTFDYVVEFGEVVDGEDGEGRDEFVVESGDAEDSVESDEGGEQVGGGTGGVGAGGHGEPVISWGSDGGSAEVVGAAEPEPLDDGVAAGEGGD